MQDLDEVRSRIAKRHHNEKQTKVLGDRQFKHLYRFAMVTMSLCICGLGYASYCKQNPQAFKG